MGGRQGGLGAVTCSSVYKINFTYRYKRHSKIGSYLEYHLYLVQYQTLGVKYVRFLLLIAHNFFARK